MLVGLSIIDGEIGMLTNGSSAFVHTYAYDSASRLTNVSDGTYNANYSYLANSPLVSQILYRSNSTTRMTTTKSYDYLNRLMQISSQPSAAGEAPISFNYALNDANQRTRVTHADGSYWVYEYDKLGQVTSGKKYWEDGTPIAGQQFEYAFDDIGNRTSTKEGGDANGGSLRSASYSVNLLNQYTNRTVSGTADMIGIAKVNATVTVNGQSTHRRGEYYQVAVANDNTSAILYPGYTNRAVLSGETNTTTGNLLIPKTPQTFWYDSDGNTLSDGVWTNTWDAENRMSATENTSGVPSGGRAKEAWTFDDEGHWIQRVLFTWSGSAYLPNSTNRFVWQQGVMLAILRDSPVVEGTVLRGMERGMTAQERVGNGMVVAVCLDTNENERHFCVTDGHGNVVALVGGTTGSRSGTYEFDSFGNTVCMTGTAARRNPVRFASQFTDDVVGTVKYLHRDHNPHMGRSANRDPLNDLAFGSTRGKYQLVRKPKVLAANEYRLFDNAPQQHYELEGLAALAFIGYPADVLQNQFRVVPEDDEDPLFTPSPGAVHDNVDGLFWRYADAGKWYKIPDYCDCYFQYPGAGTLTVSPICTCDGCAIWLCEVARRGKNPTLNPACRPGWYPNSGSTRSGHQHPFPR